MLIVLCSFTIYHLISTFSDLVAHINVTFIYFHGEIMSVQQTKSSNCWSYTILFMVLA